MTDQLHGAYDAEDRILGIEAEPKEPELPEGWEAWKWCGNLWPVEVYFSGPTHKNGHIHLKSGRKIDLTINLNGTSTVGLNDDVPFPPEHDKSRGGFAARANVPALLELAQALIDWSYACPRDIDVKVYYRGFDSPVPLTAELRFDMNFINDEENCGTACCAFGLGLRDRKVVELTGLDMNKYGRGPLQWTAVAATAYGMTEQEAAWLFMPSAYLAGANYAEWPGRDMEDEDWEIPPTIVAERIYDLIKNNGLMANELKIIEECGFDFTG